MSELLQDYVDTTIKKIVDTPELVLTTTTVSTKSVIVQIKIVKYVKVSLHHSFCCFVFY